MRVLSLGAGVQSSTLLLMAREGELDLDVAVFADTQWEPAAVYAHLEWLESVSSVPIERVTHGDIRADTVAATRSASLPFYVQQADGSQGMGRRQCSKEYKIYPIRRWLRDRGASRIKPAVLVFGISLDEHQRMRDSGVSYAVHEYPLVERRMMRGDCLMWLGQHGYPQPPKSACIGCPYRRNSEWRNLTPAEFADAIDFDAAIRRQRDFRGQQFVHRSCTPLLEVDLRSEQDRGQLEMFRGRVRGGVRRMTRFVAGAVFGAALMLVAGAAVGLHAQEPQTDVQQAAAAAGVNAVELAGAANTVGVDPWVYARSEGLLESAVTSRPPVVAASPPVLPAVSARVECIIARESGGANVANARGSGAVGVAQYMPSTFAAHAAEMGHPEYSPWNPAQARAVAAHDLALGRRGQWTVGGC